MLFLATSFSSLVDVRGRVVFLDFDYVHVGATSLAVLLQSIPNDSAGHEVDPTSATLDHSADGLRSLHSNRSGLRDPGCVAPWSDASSPRLVRRAGAPGAERGGLLYGDRA